MPDSLFLRGPSTVRRRACANAVSGDDPEKRAFRTRDDRVALREERVPAHLGDPSAAGPLTIRGSDVAQSAEAFGSTLGGHASSVASNFTGAYAVVAPMLAVWEIAAATGQWREHAFAASHASRSAIVETVTTPASRSILPSVTETLVFTPPGAQAPCHVAVEIGRRPPDVPGQALTVIPRSSACQAPLLPGQSGDPMSTALVALVFLVSGVASVKTWFRLHRHQASRTDVPHATWRGLS